jgi:hypothetical protein
MPQQSHYPGVPVCLLHGCRESRARLPQPLPRRPEYGLSALSGRLRIQMDTNSLTLDVDPVTNQVIPAAPKYDSSHDCGLFAY